MARTGPKKSNNEKHKEYKERKKLAKTHYLKNEVKWTRHNYVSRDEMPKQKLKFVRERALGYDKKCRAKNKKQVESPGPLAHTDEEDYGHCV